MTRPQHPEAPCLQSKKIGNHFDMLTSWLQRSLELIRPPMAFRTRDGGGRLHTGLLLCQASIRQPHSALSTSFNASRTRPFSPLASSFAAGLVTLIPFFIFFYIFFSPPLTGPGCSSNTKDCHKQVRRRPVVP